MKLNLIAKISGILTAIFLIDLLISKNSEINNIIASSSIIVGLGIALITLADLWERDKIERFKENLSIFYDDIKKEKRWRRWPFLKRSSFTKLLNGEAIMGELKNPQVQFDIGSHNIDINLPTVVDDFFDLPIFEDYLNMKKYHKSFLTTCSTKYKNKNHFDKICEYECVYDILKSATNYRLSRAFKHFGIFIILTTFSITITMIINATFIA
ncbi:MAG: hypothetical protein PHO91_01580 [Patescibacteria group bacterium]|nr:hypothetical protein [Patescibacteria group bacterium]